MTLDYRISLLMITFVLKVLYRCKSKLIDVDRGKWIAKLLNENGQINGNKLRSYRLNQSDLITKTRILKYIENFTTLTSTHNLCVFAKIRKKMYTPVNPSFTNEYPQSMCCYQYKKNNVYPCKPQFYYIKVGFKGVKII